MEKEEKEMLETRSMPLRNYLMLHVMPTLSKGLVEACKVKPEDPIDYLVSTKRFSFIHLCDMLFPFHIASYYLFKCKFNKNKSQIFYRA